MDADHVSGKLSRPPRILVCKYYLARLAIFGIALTAWLSATPAQGQLTFNLTPAAGMSQEAKDGFTAAAARWSAIFNDNVTINIDIDFKNLGTGTLGLASTSLTAITYANARTALVNDAKSVDDLSSSAALQAGPNFKVLLNRVTNGPNGADLTSPFFDNDASSNNNTILMTTANAKALGFSITGSDATISFNSTGFTWDFDPSNGITAGAIDFVGVATHEIGHALGFMSGVDTLDHFSAVANGGPQPDTFYNDVSTADLFRFSTRSINPNSALPGAGPGGTGVIDWTADNTEKYFSVDGGLTQLALFSNGVNFGDGRQASHWKDSQGIGILDPTAAQGELLAISAMDTRMLDVIGWNLAPVPEPGSLLLLAAVGGLVAAVRRRRGS